MKMEKIARQKTVIAYYSLNAPLSFRQKQPNDSTSHTDPQHKEILAFHENRNQSERPRSLCGWRGHLQNRLEILSGRKAFQTGQAKCFPH